MRPTPRVDAFANEPAVDQSTAGIASDWCKFACTLERELAEAVELLRAIVVLDDGDKPDLWHYQDEFVAARAFLKRMEGK